MSGSHVKHAGPAVMNMDVKRGLAARTMLTGREVHLTLLLSPGHISDNSDEELREPRSPEEQHLGHTLNSMASQSINW